MGFDSGGSRFGWDLIRVGFDRVGFDQVEIDRVGIMSGLELSASRSLYGNSLQKRKITVHYVFCLPKSKDSKARTDQQ